MDFQEPEHVGMLRDSVRRFVEREMPREAACRWDRDNHFPRDVFDKLAGLGVMGLTVPEAYGGSGREVMLLNHTIAPGGTIRFTGSGYVSDIGVGQTVVVKLDDNCG